MLVHHHAVCRSFLGAEGPPINPQEWVRTRWFADLCKHIEINLQSGIKPVQSGCVWLQFNWMKAYRSASVIFSRQIIQWVTSEISGMLGWFAPVALTGSPWSNGMGNMDTTSFAYRSLRSPLEHHWILTCSSHLVSGLHMITSCYNPTSKVG